MIQHNPNHYPEFTLGTIELNGELRLGFAFGRKDFAMLELTLDTDTGVYHSHKVILTNSQGNNDKYPVTREEFIALDKALMPNTPDELRRG